jgi:hypothetical protein
MVLISFSIGFIKGAFLKVEQVKGLGVLNNNGCFYIYRDKSVILN